MNIQLKQRVFGAIIVLALIIIFVPMLFNKHQKDQVIQDRVIPTFPPQPVVNKALPNMAAQEEQVENILSSENSTSQSARLLGTPVPSPSAANTETAKAVPAQLEIKLQSEESQGPSVGGAVNNPSSKSAGATVEKPLILQSQPSAQPSVVPATQQATIPQNNVSGAAPSSTKAPVEISGNENVSTPSLAGSVSAHQPSAPSTPVASLAERETAQLTHEKAKTSPFRAKKKAVPVKKFTEPFFIRDNLASSNNVSIPEGKRKRMLAQAKTHFTGWVIQLGNFEKTSHADKLLRSLRQQGYTAFAYQSKNKKGILMTKVFIGPFVQKELASAQLKKLHDTEHLSGFLAQFDATNLH